MPLRVGSVGRLDAAKCFDLLVDAVADADLLLIGDGPERELLLERANEHGRPGRLEVTGWVDDARSLLATIDIFVLPSLSESFPLSVVEAMLAERAVVATDVGSVAEAVLDGKTGLLVPARDLGALRTAIDRLLEDASLRRQLGRAARVYALDRFTSETMARAFDELYESIL